MAPATTSTTEDRSASTATTSAPVTTTTTEQTARTASIVKTSRPQDGRTRPAGHSPPAPPPVASPGPSDAAFLACIRMRESHNNYTAVSANGNYRGAYQFNQPAWDSTARHAGRGDLVGRLANTVAPADQDAIALDLYHWQGSKPWGGACD